MGKERTRKKASFGVVFWIAVILLIAIIFLFNLPSIRRVLTNTGFIEVVFEERDQDTDSDGIVPTDEATPSVENGASETVDDQEAPGAPIDVPIEDAPRNDVTVEPEIVVEPETNRTTTLFFIRVTDDGRILVEPVQRRIRLSGGPLTHTVNALIEGPNADDLNRGLLSLVPQGTELISARVSDGVAFLNFNEAFRFNTMGLEGYLAQMRQIVHTATVFSTVDAVQILINGEVVEYLGGDGVFIGSPLTPSDFVQ